MEVKVFVYGTLQTGEYNHRVVERFVIDRKPGKVRGRLYSVGNSFPALVLDNHGYDIEGEWLTISEGGLFETDRLEGYKVGSVNNFYDRLWIVDNNGGTEGWIYVWKTAVGRPEIKSGSWKQWLQLAG